MKLGVYIGRFQPFHLGHLHVIRQALYQVDRLLILVGSSGEPRTVKNPWTAQERLAMIVSGLPDDIPDVIDFAPIFDYGDDRIWSICVRGAVYEHLADVGGGSGHEILLVGHEKDHTSFYLSMFPQWGRLEVAAYRDLSSTPLRTEFFLRHTPLPPCDVPKGVSDWVEDWVEEAPESYGYVTEEYLSAQAYRDRWAGAPFEPTLVTTDALVVCGEEVALIRRGRMPGKGLLAIPGGFLESMRLLDNALKEFGEECGEELPAAELRKHLVTTRVFDKPDRDPRGRFITHVHLFVLPLELKPDLVFGDDAEWAGWVHYDDLHRSEFFADHFQILQLMLPCRAVPAADLTK